MSPKMSGWTVMACVSLKFGTGELFPTKRTAAGSPIWRSQRKRVNTKQEHFCFLVSPLSKQTGPLRFIVDMWSIHSVQRQHSSNTASLSAFLSWGVNTSFTVWGEGTQPTSSCFGLLYSQFVWRTETSVLLCLEVEHTDTQEGKLPLGGREREGGGREITEYPPTPRPVNHQFYTTNDGTVSFRSFLFLICCVGRWINKHVLPIN